jgi:hypothetical protein
MLSKQQKLHYNRKIANFNNKMKTAWNIVKSETGKKKKKKKRN